ncbi:hypothetical protein ACE1CB_11635 [Aerosakkonema sp. BLCC-F2]
MLSTIASIVFSFNLGLTVTDALKGKNYSDVGVPMYANSDTAYHIGLVIYPLVSGLLILLINKSIGKNSLLASSLGIPLVIISLFLYIPLLWITVSF